MTTTARKMTLVGFMQASNVSVYAGSWRHPDADLSFLTAGYYQRIARALEDACFDLLFFDDRLAMPGIYGNSVADTVRTGARAVKLDVATTLATIIGATTHLGLGATYSTTYYSPFHIARVFGTLDHLSGGRAAWNVVTSVNDAEAQNYGVELHLGHDERYDHADDFLEATFGLWDSWADDALVLDQPGGTFADPAKVREVHHEGPHFSVRGPLTVPRTPQGRPVVIQAGSSGRGRDFAARWADVIFIADRNRDAVQQHYQDQRAKIAAAGRDPDQVKIVQLVYAIVGDTEEEARAEEQRLLELVDPMASMVLLSEVTNLDFAGFDLDDEITEEFLEGASGIRGFVDGVRQSLGRRAVTLRDLAAQRATLNSSPRFVGTGEQVAAEMADWFESGVCDGFVVAWTHTPGTYEAFGRSVTPELQRLGVLRTGYDGTTLRENLGLERPART